MMLDVLIVGGGAAGLWLADELRRRRYASVLVESQRLGAGQTIASQGIIHGGLKYTLQGMFTRAADAIREMPAVWRACLAGTREPDLVPVRIRSDFCHLWRTKAATSRAAMVGARVGLRVRPVSVDVDARPAALAGCPGSVARLDEQVIDPRSLVEHLSERNDSAVVHADLAAASIARDDRGWRIVHPRSGGPSLTMRPRFVILCAGAGNGALRRIFGLAAEAMQIRPLHMVMVRGRAGELPELNGHCVDGRRTRVTITSDVDSHERRIWQIGGQIAEDGVKMNREELISRAEREIADVLPGLDLREMEWATYRADRAEYHTPRGRRPDDVAILQEGSIITAWPTKLALVPRLAERIADRLPPPAEFDACNARSLDLQRPDVALPPWEEEGCTWT